MKRIFPLVFLAILCLVCSCKASNESVTPAETDVPMSASQADLPLESSYLPIITIAPDVREPEDYDILRDATQITNYDPEYGHLGLYEWRIESFDFLEEFKGVKSLSIASCYIPVGVTIPKTAALDDLIEFDSYNIIGTGVVDLLADCLPLPKLEILRMDGAGLSTAILPNIPSLTDIFVNVPNALEVISNNTHITGSLQFGVRFQTTVHEEIQSISGIEHFKSVQYLTPPHSVRDLAPLSGCTALRILDIYSSEHIDTLEPLYALEHLEEILMSQKLYDALSPADLEHFSLENNSDANAVHVYFIENRDESEGATLSLRGVTIESFDFLLEYPNLKSLSISDCDIADGLVLPKIDTLVDLYIIDPNVMELIANNSHLPGALSIYTAESGPDSEWPPDVLPLSSLDGIERFTRLESLNVGDPVHDISAVAGCENLRVLSILASRSVDTLEPLFGLSRLRSLLIDPQVFRTLPLEEQQMFNGGFNRPHKPRGEWR